jgi:hypothetical protein
MKNSRGPVGNNVEEIGYFHRIYCQLCSVGGWVVDR